MASEAVESADECRLFADDAVTLVDKAMAGKAHNLLSAACYDKLIIFAVSSVTLLCKSRESFNKGSIAFADAVLKSENGLILKHVAHNFFDVVNGECVGCRVACGKGNCVTRAFENFSDNRGLERSYSRRKLIIHKYFQTFRE